MINVGLMCDISLRRWQQSLNIMIEKEKGNPKLHRLCIIQLFEADFNLCLKPVFGDRPMGFAYRYCGLNESQYGSRAGYLFHGAILNKVLTYDILHATTKDVAYADFDAVANYDRMIPELVALACKRLGLGDAPGKLS